MYFSGAKHPLTLVSQAMLSLCDEKLKEVDMNILLGQKKKKNTWKERVIIVTSFAERGAFGSFGKSH